MKAINWVCAVPAAHAREEEDRWYGVTDGLNKFGRLYWLRSNRKACLAEATEYLDGNGIEYAVLRDRWNRGQYVIATDSDINPDRPLPEGYWDANSDYWKKFSVPDLSHDHGHKCAPVITHQHADLSWCITFGDSHGVSLGDLIDALMKLPRKAEIYDIAVEYYNESAADECEGQPVPDEAHTTAIVTIQTTPMLCPEHAAEIAAARVVREAEQIAQGGE